MVINAERVSATYNFTNVLNTQQKYTIPFPFLDPDHIKVYLYRPDGKFVQLRTPLHYFIRYNKETHMGNLFTNADLTMSDTIYNKLVIRRHTPRTQELLFIPYGLMYAKSKERALDKLTMIALEIEHEITKIPKLPVTHDLVEKGIEFPHVEPLGVIRYNQAGTALETVPTSELVSIVEDKTPALGGDLEGANKKIKDVLIVETTDLTASDTVTTKTLKVTDEATIAKLGGNLDGGGNKIENLLTLKADNLTVANAVQAEDVRALDRVEASKEITTPKIESEQYTIRSSTADNLNLIYDRPYDYSIGMPGKPSKQYNLLEVENISGDDVTLRWSNSISPDAVSASDIATDTLTVNRNSNISGVVFDKDQKEITNVGKINTVVFQDDGVVAAKRYELTGGVFYIGNDGEIYTDKKVTCLQLETGAISFNDGDVALPTNKGTTGQVLRRNVDDVFGDSLEWYTPTALTSHANLSVDNLTTKNLHIPTDAGLHSVNLKYKGSDDYTMELLDKPSYEDALLTVKSITGDDVELEWTQDLNVEDIDAGSVNANNIEVNKNLYLHNYNNPRYKVNLTYDKTSDYIFIFPEKPSKIDKTLSVKSITDEFVDLEWKDPPAPTLPVRDYIKFYTKNYKEIRLRLDNIYTEAVVGLDDHGHLTVTPNSDSASITLDVLKNDNTSRIQDAIIGLLDINKLEYEYDDITSLKFTNDAIEGQRYLIVYVDETVDSPHIIPTKAKIPLLTEYRFTSATEVEVWRYTVNGQIVTEQANQPTTENYATFKNTIKNYRLPAANMEENALLIQSDTDRKIVQHGMELHEIQLFDIVARKSTFSQEKYFTIPAYSRHGVPDESLQYYRRDFGGSIGVKEGFIFASSNRFTHPAKLFYVDLAVNAAAPYEVFSSGWLPKYTGRPPKIYSFAIDSHEGKDYLVRHFTNYISHYEIYWDSANNKLKISTTESKKIVISAIHGTVNKPFIISSGMTQDHRWTIIGESGTDDAHTFEVDEDGNVHNYATLLQSSNQLGAVCIVNFASGYQLMTKQADNKLYKITTTRLGTVEVKVNWGNFSLGSGGRDGLEIFKHPKEGYVWASTPGGFNQRNVRLLKSDDGWRTAKPVNIREHFIQLPAADFFKIHGFRD